jgi:hypothetical protein
VSVPVLEHESRPLVADISGGRRTDYVHERTRRARQTKRLRPAPIPPKSHRARAVGAAGLFGAKAEKEGFEPSMQVFTHITP